LFREDLDSPVSVRNNGSVRLALFVGLCFGFLVATAAAVVSVLKANRSNRYDVGEISPGHLAQLRAFSDDDPSRR
jgi:hypothetical protein